jgi:membrane-anchored protein YejM (alkaline phosphatase superfamily)
MMQATENRCRYYSAVFRDAVPLSLKIRLRRILRRSGSEAGVVDVQDCTTREFNTHKTDVSVVRYPWHPWFGRQVTIRWIHIKALYADFNTKVKKGRLVALIDPAPIQAAVDQARATLNNAGLPC